MIVLLNGAFGVGKTTVAKLLAQQLPGSAVFDPERFGFVLQRLHLLARKPVDDFQDLASWRRATIAKIRLKRYFRGIIVVPMAFSNQAYLSAIRERLGQIDKFVLHFCLVAPLPVVLQRLEKRSAGSAASLEWQRRRAAECCLAHQSQAFFEHVSTEARTPTEVAQHLVGRIMQLHATRGAA